MMNRELYAVWRDFENALRRMLYNTQFFGEFQEDHSNLEL